jgi:hypothetical protein
VAAPAWVKSNAGVVDTTGAFASSLAGVAVGNLIVFQVNADGDTDFNAVTFTDTNNTIEDLAGTDNTMTAIAAQAIGSSVSSHWLWLGRALATTVSIDASTAGEDVYCQIHEFGDHNNAGTTLADVIENVTAGSFLNGTGSGTTLSDTSVQTLGADRLACNFIAANNAVQASFGSFAGETGGDWILRTSFGSTTGTDAAVGLQTATIASAGTINGGTDPITTASWGVIGFALIPAVVGGAVEDPYPYIAGGYFPTEG